MKSLPSCHSTFLGFRDLSKSSRERSRPDGWDLTTIHSFLIWQWKKFRDIYVRLKKSPERDINVGFDQNFLHTSKRTVGSVKLSYILLLGIVWIITWFRSITCSSQSLKVLSESSDRRSSLEGPRLSGTLTHMVRVDSEKKKKKNFHSEMIITKFFFSVSL